MPLPNSDKDNYSIDEMMGRLKRHQSTEVPPELVTRSDGSQALKVKKRRRRTDQTANKEIQLKKHVQIAQIACAVLLLTSLGLVLGIGFVYVNSPGYRDSLTAKIESASGAKVEMEQFRMNPLAAKADTTKLSWPAGNVLEKLELIGATASISPSSFLGRIFGGDEIVAKTGKLFLKSSDPSKPVRHVSKPEGTLPVRFSRYAVPHLDINFGAFGGLSKTEASFFPSNIPGQAEIRFSGGTLQLADWPSLALDRAYIRVRNSVLQIQSMRFNLPEVASRQTSTGFIDFSGPLTPIGDKGKHSLLAKLGNFPLSYLVSRDLSRFFVGKVDSSEIPNSNFLSFDVDSPENAKLEVTVTSSVDSRIDMSGFKFMQMLAVAFNDRWYEYPVFDDDVTMVVRRMGQDCDISGLNLVKRGRMVVRGDVFNGEGGSIKGKIRIGIPETTVTASGDKKLAKMFGEVREGYRWLDLEISGTGAVPEDNFRTLYKDTSYGESAAPDEGTPQDSFEGLIEEK